MLRIVTICATDCYAKLVFHFLWRRLLVGKLSAYGFVHHVHVDDNKNLDHFAHEPIYCFIKVNMNVSK